MRSRALALTVVALAMTALLPPMQESTSAQAGAAIVISEYRFRGPLGGNDEFIELFNRGTEPVNLGGWTIRASNNNIPPVLAARVTIAANTIINPGCFFLAVNTNSQGGYSGGVPGNQTYTVGFADDGGVALVRTLPTAILDQVGQGTVATAYGEGTRLPMVTTNINRGIERRPGGTQGHLDTNDNFNDFRHITPGNPQNSSSACLTPGNIAITTSVAPASVEQGGVLTVFGRVFPGTVPPSSGVQVVGDLSSVGGSATTTLFDDGVSPDVFANDNVFTVSAFVPANNPLGTRSLVLTASDAQNRSASNRADATVIAPAVVYVPHDIQGAGAASPFASGTSVAVRGVVTARKSNGFFLQTEPGMEDADTDTSEGLFVVASGGALATAQVGRVLHVAGSVAELVPATDTGSAPVTALTAVAVTDLGPGALPQPFALTGNDVSAAGSLDQLERFEGMRVSVASLTAVSGTGGTRDEVNAASTSDGAFYAVLAGQARPFREPGVESGHPVLPCATTPCNVPMFDGNPERLRVDSDGLEGLSPIDLSSGAVVTDVTGPLDYALRAYTILPEAALAPVGGTTLGGAAPPARNQFTIASFNMERFYDATDDPGSDVALTPAAYQTRLAKASLTIRNVLHTPDIVALQEVENLSALFALANRIDSDAAAAGAPAPQYASFLFEGNGLDGGDVGFLMKQAGGRVTLWSLEQIGKADTFTDPGDDSEDLLHDRPPVVLRVTIGGPSTSLPQNVTVIVSHLRTSNGIELNDAAGRLARTQRRVQAEFLANYIQGRQINDPSEAIVSLGGYNAFSFNDGYVDSVGTIRGLPTAPDMVATASPDLVSPDLVNAGDAPDRYSEVSGGNARALDHVLISANLAAQFAGLVHPRVNADFPEVLRGDATTPSRLSDKDPALAYFNFPVDVDPPVFSFIPDEQIAEAIGADGAAVSYESPAASDNLDVSVEVTCEPLSGSTFALGSTGVTCSTRDLAGNLATVAFTVTVRDTTAPALSLPLDLTGEADSPSGTSVSFVATATDAVSAVPEVTCTPASGSTFALGDTLVSCVATDAAGNSASGTLTIRVRDTVAPVLTVPAQLTEEARSAAGRAIDFAISATDAVTLSPAMLCSPASGSTFRIGWTTVMCWASDNAGNSSTAMFRVQVQDTTAPVLTLPANITAEATSASGRVVWFTRSATDAVTAPLSVPCSRGSGTTFALGTTTVTCTTRDAAGNVTSGAFTVTITAPVLGRLSGAGEVASASGGVSFHFDAREAANFTERGSLTLRVHGAPGSPDRLLSASVADVRFSNTGGYNPGPQPPTGVDTVTFTGTGSWNGQAGYRFEVTASDRGEPGIGVDTFSVTLYAPNGSVVESAGGTLLTGNIQSHR